MVFALEQLAQEPEGMGANVALESFAVHARCLFEFLVQAQTQVRQ